VDGHQGGQCFHLPQKPESAATFRRSALRVRVYLPEDQVVRSEREGDDSVAVRPGPSIHLHQTRRQDQAHQDQVGDQHPSNPTRQQAGSGTQAEVNITRRAI